VGQGKQRMVQRRQPLRLERLSLPSTAWAPAGRTPSFGEHLRRLNLAPTDVVLRSATRSPLHELAEEPRLGPGPEIAKALELGPHDEVLWLLRLRLARNEPLALQ